MLNHDEALLRGRTLRVDAPFPVMYQALRIALYDEYAARAFYARVNEAFGAQPPFSRIVLAEDRHIASLGALCERYGVPRPLDPFPQETRVEPTWRANLERALRGEAANVQLYQALLPHILAQDVRSTFLSLQSASRDQHLPAFAQALQAALAQEGLHAARGIPPSQAYARHAPLTQAFEQGLALLSGQPGVFGVLGPLVRATHPAMLAGFAIGGMAVHLLRRTPSSSQERSS